MSRIQAVIDHLCRERLIQTALDRFDQLGYHRTSIKEIAAGADCSVAAFYAHFRSKQAILLELIAATYGAAVAEVETAVALAGSDPASRLEAAVWARCETQLRYQRAFRVAEAELANLEAEDRERMVAKRVELTRIVRRILSEGAASGVFDSEPEVTARALATICGAVGDGYDPGGNQVPRRIAQAHCELAARLAGVRSRQAPALRRVGHLPERRSA